MSEVATRLMSELSLLSETERLQIAHALLESVPSEFEDETWEAELNARYADLVRDGKKIGIPVEDVFPEHRDA